MFNHVDFCDLKICISVTEMCQTIVKHQNKYDQIREQIVKNRQRYEENQSESDRHLSRQKL